MAESCWARRLSPAMLWAISGCVFPSSSVSGVELSWLFVEGNEVDDDLVDEDDENDENESAFVMLDGARRVRTCIGYGVDHVEVFIQDVDDEDRSGRLSFACGEGYQTPHEFQLESSDVFIDLHPGEYQFEAEVFTGRSVPIVVDDRNVVVPQRSLTAVAWNFVPDRATWHLRLEALDTCDTLALRLLYDDPAIQLAQVDPPDDQDDAEDGGEPVVYRRRLTSTTGLSLGGRAIACSALNLTQGFEDVDPGNYQLEVTIDDELRCTVPVTIQTAEDPFRLDLADLPCPG